MLTYAPPEEEILNGGCTAIAAVGAAIDALRAIACNGILFFNNWFSLSSMADSGAAYGEAGTLHCLSLKTWKADGQ